MSKQSTSALVRMSHEDLAEINQRAEALGLSRNDYMLRSALGQITNKEDALSRIASLEERFERLEERVYQYS